MKKRRNKTHKVVQVHGTKTIIKRIRGEFSNWQYRSQLGPNESCASAISLAKIITYLGKYAQHIKKEREFYQTHPRGTSIWSVYEGG